VNLFSSLQEVVCISSPDSKVDRDSYSISRGFFYCLLELILTRSRVINLNLNKVINVAHGANRHYFRLQVTFCALDGVGIYRPLSALV